MVRGKDMQTGARYVLCTHQFDCSSMPIPYDKLAVTAFPEAHEQDTEEFVAHLDGEREVHSAITLVHKG